MKSPKLICWCSICFAVLFYTIFTFEQQHSVAEHLRSYTHGEATDSEYYSGTSNENYKGYHSQWGQDRWVANYLSTIRRSDGAKGIYIELGANDGVTHSNTAYFEQILAYDGLCIEPIELNYNRLVKNRPTCKAVHGGVHNECPSATREFMTFADPYSGLSGWVDTYDPSKLKSYESSNYETSREAVPCYKLSTLLEDNGFSSRQIDYLSLDTEGAELTVLQSMELETACSSKDPVTTPCARRPKVIQVEVRRRWQKIKSDEVAADGSATYKMVVKEDDLFVAEKEVRDFLAAQGYEVSREFTAPWQPNGGEKVKGYDLLFVRKCDAAV